MYRLRDFDVDGRARTQSMSSTDEPPAAAEHPFVCVLGTFSRSGDGLVRYDSQWPPDLQRQGVPVVVLPVPHLTAMHSKLVAQALADLVRTPQHRWTPAQVEAARVGMKMTNAPPMPHQ